MEDRGAEEGAGDLPGWGGSSDGKARGGVGQIMKGTECQTEFGLYPAGNEEPLNSFKQLLAWSELSV